MIERIQGLKNLTRLSNLLLKNNRIGLDGLRDLTGLLECQSVSCLDIQSNKISAPEFVDEVLAKMENIAVVYLQNNEFNKQISHYRKTLINKISTLKYIDDKPIF
jgi:dynein assembly factor 1